MGGQASMGWALQACKWEGLSPFVAKGSTRTHMGGSMQKNSLLSSDQPPCCRLNLARGGGGRERDLSKHPP